VIELPSLVAPRLVQSAELGCGSDKIVLDFIAQKGLPFYKDIFRMMPGYYKGQPKPELARVVWDTKARTSTPPVILSHRAMVGGEASDMPKQGFTVKAALLDWCIAFKAGNVPPYLGDWAAC